MHYIIPRDSRSPPETGSVVTRAQPDAHNDTAQPALTSGFGAVLEKEHELRSATEESVGRVNGQHAGEIDRLLCHQNARLGANIALLAQRYEALPTPARFVSWNDRRRPPASPRRTEPCGETELLHGLIARHQALLGDIETLISGMHDGQRGELILAEVSRNHQEMAALLTALLDETQPQFPKEAGQGAAEGMKRAQENWDSEGGAVRTAPPPNP